MNPLKIEAENLQKSIDDEKAFYNLITMTSNKLDIPKRNKPRRTRSRAFKPNFMQGNSIKIQYFNIFEI